MVELVTLFKDFGYPAIISAVLIWIIVTRLEALRSAVADQTAVNQSLTTLVEAKLEMMEKSVESNMAAQTESRQIVEENRRTLGAIAAILKIKKGSSDIPTRPRG